MKQISLYRVIECNFVTTSSNILSILKRKPKQDSEKKKNQLRYTPQSASIPWHEQMRHIHYL